MYLFHLFSTREPVNHYLFIFSCFNIFFYNNGLFRFNSSHGENVNSDS